MSEKILDYLHGKFPSVEDKVFYTDYAGDVHANVIGFELIAQEIQAEGNCTGSLIRAKISVEVSPRGYKYLDVRARPVAREADSQSRFESMFEQSGLTQKQRGMTFENYEYGKNPDLRLAVREAFNASAQHSNLIISGKYGTGKTHLAVAIALERMKHGEQAVFRLTSAMLDELREIAWKNYGGYFDLIKKFKTAPCLILDDLGKEKNSQAGMDYLHQIIDYRYCNELQTIITTQAVKFEDLVQMSGVDFVAPIISRVLENGRWITISNAPEYRLKKGLVRNGN